MGVDLHAIGKHNISFDNKSYIEIGNEILEVLNNIPNYIYRDYLVLDCNKKTFVSFINSSSKIKMWDYPECTISLEEYVEKYIDMTQYFTVMIDSSLFDFTIYFNKSYFIISGIDRYTRWFLMPHKLDRFNIYRNSIRKILFYIIKAFGHDSIIYIPDDAIKLSEYSYGCFEGTYKEMMNDISSNYGEPQSSFEDMYKIVKNEKDNNYNIDNGAYFIDKFEDFTKNTL